MRTKKRNIVEWAMHYHNIVILLTVSLIALGIYGLKEMNKNEFPNFTVRQGLVIAAYPGATSSEIEEEVTKQLENYIFSFKEVKKSKTSSQSQDGMCIIQVELNDDLNNKDEFWSKFKHGINNFKTNLPKGVLALMVMDDFGDTSALLLTMESKDKTYRELNDYMDNLQDRLRTIESIGRMTVSGMQKEQISVYLNNERLSHYGITDKILASNLFSKGFTTMSGQIKDNNYTSPIYVARSMNTLRDIQEMIVFSDPIGNIVRLKDVARVVKEYPEPDSYYITNNGKKCLLLSIEMKSGKNIVQMGEDVKVEIEKFKETIPADVEMKTITDQSQVVNDSVKNFLVELLIAIFAVILVVMLLLPMKIALVSASTIPITIFISLGLFYALGIELNTVTLAALIVTLGMIVDNSIVIIDSYMEKLAEGKSRWHASIESATHFFKSIFSATLAISITFFPFLLTTKGMTKDFLNYFPWAISLILFISLLVAQLLVPFMQFFFIKKPIKERLKKDGTKSFSFLDVIQNVYNKAISLCFKHPLSSIGLGFISVIIGVYLMSLLPQKLMPTAERNQFAVEIYMPTGTSLKKTAQVADSLETILRKDNRILSIASFKGASSPRFQTSYAPQMGGSNFAQFIVNTTDNKTTEQLITDYSIKYSGIFPGAIIRFKQLGYSEAASPIEVRLSGNNMEQLKNTSDSVMSIMRDIPGLYIVRNNFKEPIAATKVVLDEESASRLGVTNMAVEMTTAMRYSTGIPMATIWNGDYDTNVVLKSIRSDSSTVADLLNEPISIYGGVSTVPLRQIASVEPTWKDGQIIHRNGIRTITIMAEVDKEINSMSKTKEVKGKLSSLSIPEDIKMVFGGEEEESEEQMPRIISALIISIAIIFVILLWHFKKVSTALLILCSLSLCLFGAASGVLIQGADFSITSTLGLISLMGILVRNGIIMFDYAEELRTNEKMTARDAIFHSAQRRMRPIFLTSAAASMGVIPMILGGSGLWMPMGTVIFYGTLITMLFILLVMPVTYWLVMSGTSLKRARQMEMERE